MTPKRLQGTPLASTTASKRQQKRDFNSPLGVGGPLGDFLESLRVLLAAVGCLGGPLRIPAGTWVVLGRLEGDFQDFPGNFGRPFGSILGSFLLFFRSFFGLRFLIDF